MSENEETITILKSEYLDLLADTLFLQCLVEVGVSEWPKVEDAQKLFEAITKKQTS